VFAERVSGSALPLGDVCIEVELRPEQLALEQPRRLRAFACAMSFAVSTMRSRSALATTTTPSSSRTRNHPA
jgi:hypothetical protein